MAKSRTIGEKSSPLIGGSFFLIGPNSGSVALFKNRTIGLYGSGLTHDISTAAITIILYVQRTT